MKMKNRMKTIPPPTRKTTTKTITDPSYHEQKQQQQQQSFILVMPLDAHIYRISVSNTFADIFVANDVEHCHWQQYNAGNGNRRQKRGNVKFVICYFCQYW